MRLYDIADGYRALMGRVCEAEGELDDALEAELDAVAGDAATKMENIVKLRAEMVLEAAALKEEEQRLAKRRKGLEGNAARLRDYLGQCLTIMGERTIRTSTHTISLAKTPPRVVLGVDEADVPDEYTETLRRVRTSEIKTALKDGAELEWAHLETGESVRIR